MDNKVFFEIIFTCVGSLVFGIGGASLWLVSISAYLKYTGLGNKLITTKGCLIESLFVALFLAIAILGIFMMTAGHG